MGGGPVHGGDRGQRGGAGGGESQGLLSEFVTYIEVRRVGGSEGKERAQLLCLPQAWPGRAGLEVTGGGGQVERPAESPGRSFCCGELHCCCSSVGALL